MKTMLFTIITSVLRSVAAARAAVLAALLIGFVGTVYLFSIEPCTPGLITFTNPAPQNVTRFGWSVAAVGSDRVLIGAVRNGGVPGRGAAYLFGIEGSLLTTFTNPTPVAYDGFGWSLAAVGGDRVIIGDNVRSAYLFNTDGTLLTTFTQPNPESDGSFGSAVAAVGSDYVLIGARYDLGEAGAAYLFSTNGMLVTTFTNPAQSTFEGDFGFAVAALGTDRVIISAQNTYVGGADSVGRAYLFSTNGTLLTTFIKPFARPGDEFGVAVAAVGSDRVLISSILAEDGAGAAYLFSTNGELITTFTNPISHSGDAFGCSLAAVGSDRVLIGAYQDGTGGRYSGSAYLFSTNGTLLITFTNPTPAIGDDFGWSLAAVGSDHVIIGAYRDATGAYEAGAAYLFNIKTCTPVLSVTRSGSSVMVSWPKSAEGFVLEQSVTLAAWSQVPTATYQTNATSIFVSVSAPTGYRFYRLSKL